MSSKLRFIAPLSLISFLKPEPIGLFSQAQISLFNGKMRLGATSVRTWMLFRVRCAGCMRADIVSCLKGQAV